jgi:hypothetical protein
MPNSICFDRNFFILVVVIIAILAIYNFLSYQTNINNLKVQLDNCTTIHPNYAKREPTIQPFEQEPKYIPERDRNIGPLQGYPPENEPIQGAQRATPASRQENSARILPSCMRGNGRKGDIYINATGGPAARPELPPIVGDPVVGDPVVGYDINNIGNPLVYPTSRPPSYLFRPLMDNPMFFFPTRGFPDKPGYIANLVAAKYVGKNVEPDSEWEKGTTDNDYDPQLPSVLQLMGLQKYPGSSKFDYYVLLPSTGNGSPIKYTVSTPKNEEVYDGDVIKVLGKAYIVKKNKSPFEYFAP